MPSQNYTHRSGENRSVQIIRARKYKRACNFLNNDSATCKNRSTNTRIDRERKVAAGHMDAKNQSARRIFACGRGRCARGNNHRGRKNAYLLYKVREGALKVPMARALGPRYPAQLNSEVLKISFGQHKP
jgi:hypothetical protein